MNYRTLSLITLFSLGSFTIHAMEPQNLIGNLFFQNQLNEPVEIAAHTTTVGTQYGGNIIAIGGTMPAQSMGRLGGTIETQQGTVWGPTIDLRLTTLHTRQQRQDVLHQLGTYIIFRDADNNLSIRRSE